MHVSQVPSWWFPSSPLQSIIWQLGGIRKLLMTGTGMLYFGNGQVTVFLSSLSLDRTSFVTVTHTFLRSM